MKLDTGVLNAKIKDVQFLVNHARTVEAIEAEGRDAVKEIKKLLKIDSALEEGQEAGEAYARSLGSLLSLNGLVSEVAKFNKDLSEELALSRDKLLVSLEEDYGIKKEDIIQKED